VLYRDGVPTASLSVGKVTFFSELDPATEWQARQVLLRAPVRAPSLAPETGATTDEKSAYAVNGLSLEFADEYSSMGTFDSKN
jgi:hypothetical protein